ncbi:MAG: ABC transporter ATP-binding protein [Planctomycetota bacterium]|jgi:ABC-type multidrug transport system fused ATPase/permease subunit
MEHFWTFAGHMLRKRAVLAWALVFAMISAGGLGIGLLTLGPALSLILRGDTLVDLANAYNANGPAIAIPQAVVGWLPTDRFDGVVAIVGVILVLTVVGGMANFMHLYLSQTLAARCVARIRQQAFRHVVHLPLVTVITRGPSEFVARLVRDAAELQRGFIALTSKAVTHVLKGLAAFAAAIYFQWQLTLTAVVLAPVMAIVIRKLGKRIRRGTRGSLAGQEGLLRVANEALHGLRAVKANTGERHAGRRFHRINKIVVREELKIRTARALTGPVVETIAVLVVGTLAAIAAKAIIAGSLPFERFLLSLGALAIAFASFRPLAGLVNEVQAAAAPAGRLAQIIAEPPETVSRVARRPPRHRVSIEFEDVRFAYPGSDRPALEEINLEIAHGERVAIVGPNGSGKTTLVSLLPRLLEPDSGRVLIDGIDIATVNLMALRRQIGVVTQETVLFRGSVAENIAFGAERQTREMIEDAARRARADEFIAELPSGYDTDLAEQGATLSGGQRQRLAIARAILQDPAILILDEATSQIDAESEAHITAALAEFCSGRTALLIAHRLSTVLNADRIVVMDRARIIAGGTHEELLETCDVYQRLAKTQLAGA